MDKKSREYKRAYYRKWRLKNREAVNNRVKEYRMRTGVTKNSYNNKQKLGGLTRAEYNVQWRKNHPNTDKINYKKRKADSVKYLKTLLRIRICMFLKSKGIKKNSNSEKLLGCSFRKVRAHIEEQFREGMNWDNHGKWHIDHIIPLASARTEDEICKLFKYTNLQPLWAAENIRKGSKLPGS